MHGITSPLPQNAFIAWCLVKKSTGTTLPLLYKYTSTNEYSFGQDFDVTSLGGYRKGGVLLAAAASVSFVAHKCPSNSRCLQ
jgi:hypothetical protein